MIDNPCDIPMIGSNYQNHGTLYVNVMPSDVDGNYDEYDDELYVDEPAELLQRGRLDFVVEI